MASFAAKVWKTASELINHVQLLIVTETDAVIVDVSAAVLGLACKKWCCHGQETQVMVAIVRISLQQQGVWVFRWLRGELSM